MNTLSTKIIALALLSLGLTGCQKGTEPEKNEQYTYVSGPSVALQKVKYDTSGQYAVIEEDIILGTVEEAEATKLAIESKGSIGSRGAISIPTSSSLWKDGILYYEIDVDVPSSNRILEAIEILKKAANLQFKPRTHELDYVRFVFDADENCSSAVGRKGGMQVIRLANRCTKWATVHELMHALGLWHEQSREDRDKYIKINWDNIKPGKEHNFELKSKQNLIGTYDFSSLMHYSFKAFSKNGLPTIVRKGVGSDTVMGQREKVSEGDVNALRKLYGGVR